MFEELRTPSLRSKVAVTMSARASLADAAITIANAAAPAQSFFIKSLSPLLRVPVMELASGICQHF
jgi:hypothetical protein